MRWLARYFAMSVVRRVAYLVVAGVLAVLVQTCAPASAASYGDQGIAYSVCQAHLSAAQAKVKAENTARGDSFWAVVKACVIDPGTAGNYTYICVINNGGSGCAAFSGNYGAPQGGAYDYSFEPAQTCAARNSTKLADAAQSYSSSGVATCVGGCQVQGTAFSTQTGGVNIYGMRDRTYSGQICPPTKASTDISQIKADKDEANKAKGPECTALDSGQTACIKTNGDYCATASSGKTFCWTPQETGKKSDGAEAQVKSTKGDSVTPPSTTIQDQEWQRKEGHQQTSCVSNTCTTYNVTNYSSVAAGTAKNSTGDNTSTGTGNTSGNGAPGKGTKDGDDDDDGDSASDSGNCTVPPVCVGDTLKCLQLKFTWKTQCNTLRSEITKGDGCAEGDVPVCAGDSCKSADYASVLQQWKQRCAAQALGEGMATRAAGISNADDAGVVSGIWGGESAGSGLTLRQDLVQVGGGGSLLPDVEIEGSHWTVPQGFYDAIAAVRMVIIAMCTVIAMFVVGRNI
ncbi:A coat protein [Xanthomonas translucens]|uniref:A coat protein n=1 Tax=Xanthomonas campestris pv. translucens TaxID=343 RepID=UPI0009C15BF0|nr:A coat protein [Xanthomonas translucens]